MLVDWLPWNHTFGGNHNVGLTLYNGGTLYIDDGKPTPAGIAETLRNLREISPTIYFNVPRGFEEVATAMESDEVLGHPVVRPFFQRVLDDLWTSGTGSASRITRMQLLAQPSVDSRYARRSIDADCHWPVSIG